MKADVRDVLVLGGGISGLTAAWHLKNAGVDVCLLEAAGDVGGCTRTERRDGFLLEKGPFNVIVRDPIFERLLEDVSEDVEVITASRAARARYLYRRGRLRAVPTNPVALATTRLLSIAGKCRLLAGLIASARPGEREETIEQAATRRFGVEVSDTMVSAVIAGIFAGDIRRLSLKACFPSVWSFDTDARSVVGHGITSALRSRRKKKGTPRRRWRGLVSIDGGLGALTATLGQRLGADLHSDCRVELIRPVAEGYEVTSRTGDGTALTMRCHRLVVAGPPQEASRLLAPLVPDASTIIDTMDSASLVVLNLGFRRGDVGHPMEGYGFLVPHNEPDFPLMGVLWADSIFPHHAPPDHRLIRVFIGGARDPRAASRSDAELLTLSVDSLRDLLQISGEPVLVDVCRYPSAIPQYHIGHTEKISRLRAIVSTQPGLHLIGNYLEGVSLNDCIRLATNVANNLINEPGAQATENGARQEVTSARRSNRPRRETVSTRHSGGPREIN